MSDVLFMTIKQVAARYATSKHSIYRWVRERRDFPKPYLLPSNIKRWKITDLEQWEQQHGVSGNPVDVHAPDSWGAA